MQIYSQRDWRWRFSKMGNTRYSIGQDGCTITCLGMILGIFPGQINQMMLGGGGYSYRNGHAIVNWTKLHSVFPLLRFFTRVVGYDNAAVLQAISDNGFCLIEVDATPIGNPSGKHWVIFIGNQQLYDPWTGTLRHTSIYTPTGYCVVSYTP